MCYIPHANNCHYPKDIFFIIFTEDCCLTCHATLAFWNNNRNCQYCPMMSTSTDITHTPNTKKRKLVLTEISKFSATPAQRRRTLKTPNDGDADQSNTLVPPNLPIPDPVATILLTVTMLSPYHLSTTSRSIKSRSSHHKLALID